MKNKYVIVTLLYAISFVAFAQNANDKHAILITNVNVFDGETEKLITNAGVRKICTGDKIINAAARSIEKAEPASVMKRMIN